MPVLLNFIKVEFCRINWVDKFNLISYLIFKTVQSKKQEGNIIGTINLVLRLAVAGENENNKNSIITCIPVGKNRLKTYIKNGKIIYKRE